MSNYTFDRYADGSFNEWLITFQVIDQQLYATGHPCVIWLQRDGSIDLAKDYDSSPIEYAWLLDARNTDLARWILDSDVFVPTDAAAWNGWELKTSLTELGDLRKNGNHPPQLLEFLTHVAATHYLPKIVRL